MHDIFKLKNIYNNNVSNIFQFLLLLNVKATKNVHYQKDV